MIRNLVLDMGNVLLNYDPQIPLELFCPDRESQEIILRELFHGPEWIRGDLGLIHDEDRYLTVKDRVPERYHPALKKCCDRWDVCMEPLPGAEGFCREMKRRGYGMYILSNASDAFYRYFPKFLPLDFFDGMVVSADVHVIKPDRAIYEHLLNKYRLEPSECLFLDDMPANVEGAESVGMNAFRFTGDYSAAISQFDL